jgi:2-polyprenyl-6-hydroxyphenyl methylase/3-demethylubiquinone-9 3-methyltransferase
MTTHTLEIQQGRRFEFGKNWLRFLQVLNEDRIVEAEKSLRAMLEFESLSGRSFLDIGSGSGLFSLAAMRLGAAKVRSFDYDPQSVACTLELKRRYFPAAERWTIEEGSVLDAAYLARLGRFDVVYAWGVLHHTGNMRQALENVVLLVAAGGKLFVAIYNDQGRASRGWKAVKTIYNQGWACRLLVSTVFIPYFIVRGLAGDFFRMRNPFSRYREYKKSRGMSLVRDWFDWLGGYPFEFAKPEEIFEYYRTRGFTLVKLKTCGGTLGNNEFVFQKGAE